MKFLLQTKRIFTGLSCLLILFSLTLPATAAEGFIDGTYIKITEEGFVADTLNGVDALYNLYGPTLYCVELPIRYYAEVYGLELRCVSGAPVILNNDDLYFEETDDPKTGDVMFGSAAARGKGYNHWAMVKENRGDSLVLFEQNWRWNGQACVNREIEYPTRYYKIYTLKSRSGAEIIPVEGSVAVLSDWAETYIRQAAEAGIANLLSDFQAAVTREDFCAMALNVLSLHNVAYAEKDTVCETAMAAGLLTDAAGAGEMLTRQEAAVITARLAEQIGALPEADTAILAAYGDADAIAPWAADAVARMTGAGFLCGTGGAFRPEAGLTNEQAVALLVRLSDNPAPAATADAAPESAGLYMYGRPQRLSAGCAAEGIVALGASNMMLSRFDRAAR